MIPFERISMTFDSDAILRHLCAGHFNRKKDLLLTKVLAQSCFLETSPALGCNIPPLDGYSQA
jgi:hypothetical protein